jgi:precorrin-6A/cobalt-precorrin-6A reductase
MTVLVLGGTAEARELAERLADLPVVTSLAGRTTAPASRPGRVRSGGFGGVAGLAAWVRDEGVVAVVDATHPFAVRISAWAAALEDVPLLRLERPAWTEQRGDRWHRVADHEAAARLIRTIGSRPLLAVGRQELAAYDTVPGLLVRSVERPAHLPPGADLVLARGPFSPADERALLVRERVDVVVTKDSGGDSTRAKLDAARELGLPVVLIERPPGAGVPLATTVDEAERWVRDRLAG